MKVNLAADLLLVYPPAYFDFRNNGEVYRPFLSSGASETITPLFSAMDHFDRRKKRLAEFAEGVIVSVRNCFEVDSGIGAAKRTDFATNQKYECVW